MIITQKEFNLIKEKEEGQKFTLKVDFGLKEVQGIRQKDKAILVGAYSIDLKDKVKENFCYQIEKEGLTPIVFFSENTNRFYKLVPTGDWPTIALGSVPMHKLSSPKEDSYNKIRLLKPYGVVLDTCMGLGYTAILASKKAKKVITFERDNTVFAIAQINPASKELFSASNIEIRRKDINLAIGKLKKDHFDCIIHDPPTFKLSPELYSVAFYGQLLRVLKPGEKMFHYTPLYKIKQGYDFPSKVKNKLKEAGFKIITYSEEAGGFLCRK
ncbi:MAG: RsmD family RNA methyltransferase [Candidatus Omnitrophota bacterium]|nr:MAG: RsmD family RNA methyltransferase [Candidatus Omnitrophota bacterium]